MARGQRNERITDSELTNFGKTSVLRKTVMCKFNALNKCKKGSECQFAHSEQELAAKPDLSFTKLCGKLNAGGCSDPRCKFAHCLEELKELAPARSHDMRADDPSSAERTSVSTAENTVQPLQQQQQLGHQVVYGTLIALPVTSLLHYQCLQLPLVEETSNAAAAAMMQSQRYVPKDESTSPSDDFTSQHTAGKAALASQRRTWSRETSASSFSQDLQEQGDKNELLTQNTHMGSLPSLLPNRHDSEGENTSGAWSLLVKNTFLEFSDSNEVTRRRSC
jgi:hypothetical protein